MTLELLQELLQRSIRALVKSASVMQSTRFLHHRDIVHIGDHTTLGMGILLALIPRVGVLCSEILTTLAFIKQIYPSFHAFGLLLVY
jgi:hypothetical protein